MAPSTRSAPTANAIPQGDTTPSRATNGPRVGCDAPPGRAADWRRSQAAECSPWRPMDPGGFFVERVLHAGRDGRPRETWPSILEHGHMDPGFEPGPDAPVAALAVSGSTVYRAEAFASISGQPRSHLAALNAARRRGDELGSATRRHGPSLALGVRRIGLGRGGLQGLSDDGAIGYSPGSSHKPRGPEAPERRSGHAAYPIPWISFGLWTCSGSRRRERESSTPPRRSPRPRGSRWHALCSPRDWS